VSLALSSHEIMEFSWAAAWTKHNVPIDRRSFTALLEHSSSKPFSHSLFVFHAFGFSRLVTEVEMQQSIHPPESMD